MNLLKIIKDTKIEGIKILEFCDFLKKADSGQATPFLYKDKDGKSHSIKCIKEYYVDPTTGRKMKTVNVSNKCNAVRQTFTLTGDITHESCFECHEKMLQRFMNSEARLLK